MGSQTAQVGRSGQRAHERAAAVRGPAAVGHASMPVTAAAPSCSPLSRPRKSDRLEQGSRERSRQLGALRRLLRLDACRRLSQLLALLMAPRSQPARAVHCIGGECCGDKEHLQRCLEAGGVRLARGARHASCSKRFAALRGQRAGCRLTLHLLDFGGIVVEHKEVHALQAADPWKQHRVRQV